MCFTLLPSLVEPTVSVSVEVERYRHNTVDCVFLFFKQKTAYEMRISDWSSDVCSSDLGDGAGLQQRLELPALRPPVVVRQVGCERADERALLALRAEIGRASCRESVCQYE